MKYLMILTFLFLQYIHAKDNNYYKNNQIIHLTPYNTSLRINSNIDYYKNTEGVILGVTDRLIVKFKNTKHFEEISDEFNITVSKKLDKKLYLFKTINKKATIDIAKLLNEKESIEYAHPDFVKKNRRR
jgi:hypothetical protein